jgi:hypothetical protein
MQHRTKPGDVALLYKKVVYLRMFRSCICLFDLVRFAAKSLLYPQNWFQVMCMRFMLYINTYNMLYVIKCVCMDAKGLYMIGAKDTKILNMI